MVSVFISHSSKDKPFARELADFLGREGDIKVWLDEREIAPGNNIVSNIEKGLDSDFVCLILSPDSVDSALVKEEWTDAFWEQTNARTTKLFGVLYRDCKIPRLLRNKSYVDLRNNHPEGFRKIRTFLLTGKPAEPTRVNRSFPCGLAVVHRARRGTRAIAGAAAEARGTGLHLRDARPREDDARARVRPSVSDGFRGRLLVAVRERKFGDADLRGAVSGCSD